MKATICLTIAILMAAVCQTTLAAEKFDPAARAAVVAPFIDATTYGLVRVDLTRIKAGPVMDLLERIVPEIRRERDAAESELSQFLDELTGAGFEEVYFTVNFAQLWPPGPVYTIVPVDEDCDVEALLESVSKRRPGHSVKDESRRIGDVLVLTDPRMITLLDSIKPEERPGLEKVFEAAGDAVLQLLVVPPPHVAKVFEAMMPTLPEQIGGGSTEVFTRGIKWISVGVNTPPETSVRMVIQSEDRRAAEALCEKLANILQQVSRNQAVKKTYPKLEDAGRVLLPEVQGDRLTLALNDENGNLETLLSAIALPVDKARFSAARNRSANYLKQLGLAMHNYYDRYAHFPAGANLAGDGKPLLSWRVHVLPYVEQNKLYEEFHLDEPWDSEHNRKLIEKMPQAYLSPASKLTPKEGRTSYLRPTGEATACPPGAGITFKDIKDGSSNTIMIVEVGDDRAVVWTKPDDLPIDMDNPAKGLGGPYEKVFNTAICDGSVHTIRTSTPADVLRALFTRAGREKIDWDEVRR